MFQQLNQDYKAHLSNGLQVEATFASSGPDGIARWLSQNLTWTQAHSHNL